MQLSPVGRALIEEFEGCRLVGYPDQHGIPTIGYGHTGPEVRVGQNCTQAEADQLLAADVSRTVVGILKGLDVQVTQNQFDALVCFAFNVGVTAEGKSTLLKQVNAGHMLLASDEFVKWDHVNGVPNIGLLRRRQAEQALFNKP